MLKKGENINAELLKVLNDQFRNRAPVNKLFSAGFLARLGNLKLLVKIAIIR